MRLKGRVEALEERDSPGILYPVAWIVCEDEEAEADAVARYEREHGPINGRTTIIWTGVPRAGVSPCV